MENSVKAPMQYEYWKVNYVSAEGNNRWTVVRTPHDWEEWQVEERFPLGSTGDEAAEITSVEPTLDEDYLYDFTEDEE